MSDSKTTETFSRQLETSYPNLAWELKVWEDKGVRPARDKKYTWCLTPEFAGTLLVASTFGLDDFNYVVKALREAALQVESWASIDVPGTFSKSMGESVVAHARRNKRWITWELVQETLILSPAQASRLAEDLEGVPAVVKEMVDFLKSWDGA